MFGSISHFLRFVGRVLREFFFVNHGLLLASAVAYNMVLALLPLLASIIVILSQFVDQQRLMATVVAEMRLFSPEFVGTIEEWLGSFLSNRKLVGWVSVLSLLFFSSMAFRVLEDAVAIIFHKRLPTLRRKFWVSAMLPYVFIIAISLGLMVITLGNAMVAAQGKISQWFPDVSHWIHDHLGKLFYCSGILSLVCLFTLFYKILPVAKVSLGRALIGAVVATVLWEGTRHLVVYYYMEVSMVNVLYGSMAGLFIFLLTLDAVVLIVLLGAQVIAILQANANAGISWYAKAAKIEDCLGSVNDSTAD